MTGESDRDLPLHDEAKARAEWRGDETILHKDGEDDAGPASEIDKAASGGGSDASDPGASILKDLAGRPPD